MPKNTDHPDVIARPPGIVAGFLTAWLVLETAWPSSALPQTAQYVTGTAIFAFGLAVVAAAMWRFQSAGTNMLTALAATALATEGPTGSYATRSTSRWRSGWFPG